MVMRITLILLFTVSLAGCAGALKPRAPMDALEVATPFNNRPAMTTYLFDNHAVRDQGWRYIRYADGSEELYDEAADPLEHTNVAAKPEHAERRRAMAKWMPATNAPDLGIKRGNRSAGDAED